MLMYVWYVYSGLEVNHQLENVISCIRITEMYQTKMTYYPMTKSLTCDVENFDVMLKEFFLYVHIL